MGAGLFGAGALITTSATLLPHPETLDVTGYWALAGAQVLVAAILLLVRLRDGWQPPLVAGAGVLAVTAAVYLNGERHGGPPLFNELFYIWPALYAGYFFSQRALIGALGLIGVTYAGVLAAIGIPLDVMFTRWIVVSSAVCGIAVAVFALRRSVDRLVARLRETSRTDGLTDILNRRGFEEAFGTELARTRRTGEPLCIAVGDIDHFKSINDRFGHGAGDRALAAVAARLRECCRGTDLLGRVGGEEFALVMPQTDLDEGLVLAERVRRAVALVRDPDGESLTISLGVAECARPEDADPDALLRAADRALYAAKDAGRDRVLAA
jgi:diguanylate cyclase (GGDEF)-like protein